jgi:hypothetical protein
MQAPVELCLKVVATCLGGLQAAVRNCNNQRDRRIGMSKFRRTVRAGIALTCTALLLDACGGGGSGTPPPPTLYSVGGTVSGLSSNASLTISNNGGDALTLTANGAFHFATKLASGAAYAVTVANDPSGEKCGVLNATGVWPTLYVIDAQENSVLAVSGIF